MPEQVERLKHLEVVALVGRKARAALIVLDRKFALNELAGLAVEAEPGSIRDPYAENWRGGFLIVLPIGADGTKRRLRDPILTK